MKGKGIVQTWEMLLRVEVRKVGNYPPAIFISHDVPKIVALAQDNVGSDFFSAKNCLVRRLDLDVTRDVLF